MESKGGFTGLEKYSISELEQGMEKADGTGYWKGVPQGIISEELSKRSEIASQPDSLPEVPKSESLPKKKSGNLHKVPSKMRFVDQQMSNVMGPGWGRRSD